MAARRVVEADHSWGLVETSVLELTHVGTRLILKAAGRNDHHIAREIHAHRNWLDPWTSRGRAPALMHGDVDTKMLVRRYLHGSLVVGTDAADDPRTYRQAGELLAMLHAQATVTDDDYEAREDRKSLAWLSKPHRIALEVEERLRAEIATWKAPPMVVVPTHGDWQPRNWLIHEGKLSVIDFGRASLRPAMSDFARLAAQDFRRNPALETTFLDGYGDDPREAGAWHRNRVREAIAIAVWAHNVGDEAFEAQGHQMIADVLTHNPQGT